MIEEYSFGSIVIDGRRYTSDLKIIKNKVVPGWWRKNGHTLEPDDILDILDIKPDVLIVGKGSPGMMKCTEPPCRVLEMSCIELIEQSTSDAVETFNYMLKGQKNISAGLHLTC